MDDVVAPAIGPGFGLYVALSCLAALGLDASLTRQTYALLHDLLDRLIGIRVAARLPHKIGDFASDHRGAGSDLPGCWGDGSQPAKRHSGSFPQG